MTPDPEYRWWHRWSWSKGFSSAWRGCQDEMEKLREKNAELRIRVEDLEKTLEQPRRKSRR